MTDPTPAGVMRQQGRPSVPPVPLVDRPTVARHPAPYTDTIIEALALLIPEVVPEGHVVHDPFAGDGRRLGELCDRLGYTFSGADIEHWRDRDERVALADSTRDDSYPSVPYAVVTSPTYNNGVNDHFNPRDDSERLTYRVRAGRALHPNNTGRWSGRGSKRGEREYWRLTWMVASHWPGVVLVNVKDSTRAGEAYPLVSLWSDLLEELLGYTVTRVDVHCPGWRVGTNHEAREETEAILVGRVELLT